MPWCRQTPTWALKHEKKFASRTNGKVTQAGGCEVHSVKAARFLQQPVSFLHTPLCISDVTFPLGAVTSVSFTSAPRDPSELLGWASPGPQGRQVYTVGAE